MSNTFGCETPLKQRRSSVARASPAHAACLMPRSHSQPLTAAYSLLMPLTAATSPPTAKRITERSRRRGSRARRGLQHPLLQQNKMQKQMCSGEGQTVAGTQTQTEGPKPTTANVQRQQQRQRSKKMQQPNKPLDWDRNSLPSPATSPIHTVIPPPSRTGSKNVQREEAAMLLPRCCSCDVAASAAAADVAASAFAALVKSGKQQQVPVAGLSAFYVRKTGQKCTEENTRLYLQRYAIEIDKKRVIFELQ